MTTADTVELCPHCPHKRAVVCRGCCSPCYLRRKRAGELGTLPPALRGRGVKVAKPKAKAVAPWCVVTGCRELGEQMNGVRVCPGHTEQVRRFLEIPVSRRA